MARYRGPVCRLCRRSNEKLFFKGYRCYADKCALERRRYAPGQHGQMRRKLSDYAIQLREKQKVKRIYGLLERQFRKYFKEAEKKKGITGETLLQFLELRFDNVVFRMGFAPNRRLARQLVKHGHFLINDKNVDIPSYRLKEGDVVNIHSSSKEIPGIQESISRIEHGGLPVPEWIEMDISSLKGKILHIPSRDEIPLEATEQLIVELYSK